MPRFLADVRGRAIGCFLELDVVVAGIGKDVEEERGTLSRIKIGRR
jgi:hypothetical protein